MVHENVHNHLHTSAGHGRVMIRLVTSLGCNLMHGDVLGTVLGLVYIYLPCMVYILLNAIYIPTFTI